jgi:predicted phage terminase large subunit-like protein
MTLELSSDSLSALKAVDVIELQRSLSRRSLDDYARFVRSVEPARHHQLVNKQLEAIERGDIKRLMLHMPPGHGKSIYSSVLFTSWYHGRHPDQHIIQASNTEALATSFGRKARNLIGVPEWPFDGVGVADDSKSAGSWTTNHGGEHYCVGVGGTVTGRRAHGCIVDDPVAGREAADSELQRQSLWEWFLSDLRTRLLPDAWMILVGTRWHELDLFGRLLPVDYAGESGPVACRDGEVWHVLNLPALAEKSDPLGRQPGEALWPEFYTAEKLEAERIAQGPRNWNALYMGRPAPEEGDYFQRDWIRYYDNPPPRNTMRIYAASDFAVTDKGGDYTVIGICGKDPDDNIYILDWWRGQTASDVWIESALDLMERWEPSEWATEAGQIAKSIGPFLDMRQRARRIYTWRKEYTSSVDKQQRAQAFRASMASGMVYFPKQAHWVPALVSELLRFPTGRHDDQVDVLSLFGRILDRMASGSRPRAPEAVKPFIFTVPGLLALEGNRPRRRV